MSNYISPFSPQLIGRSGQDRVLYRDYLQSRSLVTDVTASVEKVNYAISESSREMIGTLEQLHERGYEMVTAAVGDLGSDVREGFEGVSWRLEDISGELTALNAKFDWGFSQMIAGIGRVNDSLEELIAIAKTPAETWAYNQYEIARDAIRRELYPEAVEALQRAISGHGDHVGYKLEYRFHYTLGILNLGDVTNIDAEILDLAKAEASFLTAARYAKTDYPAEAGIAMTAAGWAAFCQNKLAESESHTKQAMAMHPQNGEAFYQLAKIQMHTKRPKEAIPNLRQAAELDPHFTIKAATDPDFLRFEKDVQSLIDSLRRDAESKASPATVEAKRILDMLREWRSEDVFQSETEVLRDVFVKAEGNLASNTFLGFLEAKSDADRIASFGSRLIGEHQQFLEKEVNEGIDSLTRFRASFQQRGAQFSYKYLNSANGTLKQVEKGVHSHGDHRRKMELLNQACKQFQAAIEESRKGIQRKRTSDAWAAAVSGAARSVFVTFIPAFIATLVIAFFLALFTGGLEQKGTRMESFIGSVIPLIYFPWLIIAGVIGASRQKKEVLDDHQNNSAEKFGIEPPLPNLGNVQRPAFLFDAASFSNQKPEVHAVQSKGRSRRGPDRVYDLILGSVPADKKIAVIKAVCAVCPGFGLAEAKALVESERIRTVLERVSKIDADAAKGILEKAGARVELKQTDGAN